MSAPAVDAMYETMASAALRIHGKDPRKLRRALTDLEATLFLAETPAMKAGLSYVRKVLGDKLRELETRASGEPVPPERYP